MCKPIVFLVCTGLGRINRGYESFTRECFETLKDSSAFDLYLIKGAGKRSKKEKVIPNLYRNGKLVKLFSRLMNLSAYSVEQASFCLALLPMIIKKKPNLIYYSDFAFGSYLWHLRRYLKFRYKLLFCNAAPNGPPYKTEDHVQQLLPVYYNIGVKADGNKLKHTFLPYAFNIDMSKNKALLHSKYDVRQQLGFLPEQKIILTVGVINTCHKRIDYVINEVALLPKEYFLIIIGQHDTETSFLIQMAEHKLPNRHLITSLAHEEIQPYYISADIFILASLQEGFPRVTVEALSYGLPCIVHNYVVNRQILGNNGIYIDMRFEGELSRCLQNIPNENENASENMQTAYNQYSWDVLKPHYTKMIEAQSTF